MVRVKVLSLVVLDEDKNLVENGYYLRSGAIKFFDKSKRVLLDYVFVKNYKDLYFVMILVLFNKDFSKLC